ncbi:hypothetical protein K503DRAFT_775777 [Rhizopogon vinicolor AM-OR11-026]|uniref:Uncharacterized protein n=1 Tax=Rhizopogon vinicolor AM-OR11-026 TaxID=1314800 RepID=A0A1B7ML11_9AGAM|nr:hypothetical protein K503DRAFT_775777 [Rhizopogon vinicolor AM-OR11-026]
MPSHFAHTNYPVLQHTLRLSRVLRIILLCEAPNHIRVPTISFRYESSSCPKKWNLTRLEGLSVSARCLVSASSRSRS